MLQYSRTPEMGPFPGHGWKGVSFWAEGSVSRGGCLCALPGGCRRGWPGGGKNLPSGRPPMDCGICRTKSPAVNKMFCAGFSRRTGSTFVAAAGEPVLSGDGGGPRVWATDGLKSWGTESQTGSSGTRRSCGGGEETLPPVAECVVGKETSPARPEGGPADGAGAFPAGKQGSSLQLSPGFSGS